MRIENGATGQKFPLHGKLSGGRPASGTSHLSLPKRQRLPALPLPWSNHSTSQTIDEPIHVPKTSDYQVNMLLIISDRASIFRIPGNRPAGAAFADAARNRADNPATHLPLPAATLQCAKGAIRYLRLSKARASARLSGFSADSNSRNT